MTKVEAKTNKEGGNIVNILGVGVSGASREEVLNVIQRKMGINAFGRPLFVVTVNPEIIMLAEGDEGYKQVLNQADLVIPDGNGLRLAGVKQVVPGRVVVEEVVRLGKNYKIFFLGGRDGVAKKMAEKYGGQWDEGADNIQFEILNLNSISNIRILNKINKFKPDLLLVAYGAPWQEKWLMANSKKLKAKVVMGVGGTFDYLTGKSKLPPQWMEQIGLEWLWRLIQEPKRWRRQVNLVKFAVKVLNFHF